MKAIYIDKEGTLKFGEFPDKKFWPSGAQVNIAEYEKDLQHAKDNAIPIQNKEYTNNWVWNNTSVMHDGYLNTIYPYNGEYETKELCDCEFNVKGVSMTCWACDGKKRKVVILKEPVKQIEPEDHLWITVMVESEYIESEGIWAVIKRLSEQFTITRK